MGAAKRRRQFLQQQRGDALPIPSGGLGNPADHLIQYPADIRDDIAAIVRAVSFFGIAGGTCFFRTAIGHMTPHMLGIPAALAIGGLIARTGPDPQRDVVAFCAEGDLGGRYSEGPVPRLLEHYWLQVGTDLVDFSVGDWRGLTSRVDPLEATLGVPLGVTQ